MDEAKARKILGRTIRDNGRLKFALWRLDWEVGWENAYLSGNFTADDLEAIAWWMKHSEEGGLK
ncbi:MAG: hypothetical protein PHO03_01860 [Candidatus Omnitrophica bacterium]|nr:hypothetical protein [Candidatus Omnitrophota bacterium]